MLLNSKYNKTLHKNTLKHISISQSKDNNKFDHILYVRLQKNKIPLGGNGDIALSESETKNFLRLDIPLVFVADLFLLRYERDFMLSPSDTNLHY